MKKRQQIVNKQQTVADLRPSSLKSRLTRDNVAHEAGEDFINFKNLNAPRCASLREDITTVAHSSASRSQRKLKRMQSWGGVARRISWQRGDLTSYCTERRSNSAMNCRQRRRWILCNKKNGIKFYGTIKSTHGTAVQEILFINLPLSQCVVSSNESITCEHIWSFNQQYP